MDYEEAVEWLEGKRSGCEMVSREPFPTYEVRLSKFDLNKTKQAYFVARYWDERNGII